MAELGTHVQFLRFAIVGGVSNALLFLFYLALTEGGVGYKLAMSIVYAFGVMQTFIFNRKWSFQHEGAIRPALIRYWTTYAVGYAFNFLALAILVDRMGFPHQIIQGGMIILLAAFLFAAQKLWVFQKA